MALPISTLVFSFTNGEFSTNRILRLNDGDILKVGATITKLVLNSGLSVTIFKLDEQPIQRLTTIVY